MLERLCADEPIRVLVSMPPQHGKTLSAHGCIVRDLLKNPSKFWAYITYSIDKGRQESGQIRALATRAGVELQTGTRALGNWRTPQGGGLLATGVGGPITGQRSLKRIVVDDAIKSNEDAESAIIRDKVFDWFQASVMSRAHPDTGIVVIGTRWHHDDLIARLAAQTHNGEKLWEVINLPAIDDYGAPLWARQRPIDFLLKQKSGMTSYLWNALYMGRPVPRGEAVFGVEVPYAHGEPTFSEDGALDVGAYLGLLAAEAFRIGGGLDLAYTEKKKSDYSVAVVLARLYTPDPDEDRYYVLDVRRAQRPPPEFHEEAIEPLEETYPGIRFRCYLATSEMGSGQFMRKLGTNIETHRARVDKFQRAQPVAAAWNAGRVFVPANTQKSPAPAWLTDFLDEVQKFTGVSDKHDDQVDALAAAFDVLARRVKSSRRPRLTFAAPLEERGLG